MVIEEIKKDQVLQLMRRTLQIPTVDLDFLDDVLLASSIRRVAGFLCPCSVTTLLTELIDSLRFLSDDNAALRVRAEDIIDKLIIGGDLLELSDVSTNDLNAKGTWIFSAPPAFIERANRKIIIFGITPDENTPLALLSERIEYKGCMRFIVPNSTEDLRSVLREMGLIEFSEKTWLKQPKYSTSEQYLERMNSKLAKSNYSGAIDDLTILDPTTPIDYYRGRWVIPKKHTGFFVAKRPQVYGAPIWCYAELENGAVQRFIDIPQKINSFRQRGCDGAWHLQMAIDKERGQPQEYRIRESSHGVAIDFFSPIPLWAERRLIAIGEVQEPQKCLFSYLVPNDEILSEEKFIKEYLWMQQTD